LQQIQVLVVVTIVPQMSMTFQYVQKFPLQHDATPCNAYYQVPQMSMTITMCTNVHCNILQVPELLTIVPQCPLQHITNPCSANYYPPMSIETQ
jgi:hypothetical protein